MTTTKKKRAQLRKHLPKGSVTRAVKSKVTPASKPTRRRHKTRMVNGQLAMAAVGFGKYFQRIVLKMLQNPRFRANLVAVVLDWQPRVRKTKGDYERSRRAVTAAFKRTGRMPWVGSREDLLLAIKAGELHIDGVVISAYHSAHYEAAKAFLRAGIPVLVDKPPVGVPYCSSNVAAARRLLLQIKDLVKTAADSNVPFLVGVQRRYEETYKWLRSYLQKHPRHLEPVRVQVLDISDKTRVPHLHRFQRDPELGCGGQLLQTGYHHVDWVLWLWKGQIKCVDVVAAIQRYQFEGVPGVDGKPIPKEQNVEKSVDVLLTIHLAGGTTVVANLALVYAGPLDRVREEVRVVREGRPTHRSERETVCLDRVKQGTTEELQQPLEVTCCSWRGKRPVEHSPRIKGAGARNEAPFKDFLDCIRHGTPSKMSPGRDQISTVGVIQAAYLSALTGARYRFWVGKQTVVRVRRA
jgi:predicted dehydrogenase